MKIADFLSPTDTLVGVRAPDKARLLQELVARAASSLQLQPSEIAAEVLKREELGSTGMGNGIAIPHARLPQLNAPFGILARLKRPMEFDAVDGEPVDLVFFLLLPPASQGDHLNALAAVARKLREPERLEKMRAAEDGETLYRELTQ